MEKCPVYAEGRASEEYFLGGRNVVCSLKAEDCPYGKGLTINFEGDPVTICLSHGLLTKIELEAVELAKQS